MIGGILGIEVVMVVSLLLVVFVEELVEGWVEELAVL